MPLLLFILLFSRLLLAGSGSETFDANDRLTSHGGVTTHFDANGNYNGLSAAQHQYDRFNRLTSYNNGAVTLVYDGDGHRVRKTAGGITTHYLVDALNPTGYAQVLEELESTDPSASGLQGWWRFDEYTGNSAGDSSGHNRHGTLNGPAWTGGMLGGALFFDGSNDRVNVPTPVISTADTKYSYSAWFNWNGTGGGADGRKFILETTGSGSPWVLSACINAGAKLQIAIWSSGSSFPGTTTIAPGRWYHVTVTWDKNGGANNLKAYLNGALEVQTTTSVANPPATTGLNIGTYRSADNRWFGGVIDDVRVYNRTLSAAEAAAMQPQVKRRYTYGLDLISQQFTDNSVYYYGYDGLGSVRYLTSSTGAVTDRYHYDAYGNLDDPNGLGLSTWSLGTATPNHYRYTGEQWDADLGLYYLRARFYDPQLGRFWTMDSYEGSQSDPLSLHKYLYAHNNPVNNIDPSGFVTIASFVSVQGIMKAGRTLRLPQGAMILDRVSTLKDVAELFSTLAATGTVNPIALAALTADFVPFNRVFRTASTVVRGGRHIVPDGKELLEATYASLMKNGTGNSTQIIGELGAGLAAKAHGFKKAVGFEPRYHGIDDIYLNGDKLVLVEAKGGVSDLAMTKAGEQLSHSWIRTKILSLRRNGLNGIADEIENAIPNRLQVMSARTKVDGPDAFIPETEIKDWMDIGEATWLK